VRIGNNTGEARRTGGTVEFTGLQQALGLPQKVERQLLENFEFNGTLVEWKDKGHDVGSRVQMEKLPGHLAWVLDVRKSNGSKWQYYIDSHQGHLLKQILRDGKGEPVLTLEYGDYHESLENPLPQPFRLNDGTTLEHYVMPGWIVYRDGQNREVARIDISAIRIQTQATD
jgi:hypothetical protein